MVAAQMQPEYRPEIQGLRTIGAVLVATFHIWGSKVSGGVDVFFVVSGFLITGSLWRELDRSAAIDVVAFWGRIARRIVPTAATVLLLTTIMAAMLLPSTNWESFAAEVVFSALHVENVKLMIDAVDYLAREEAPSPVQQFWALSVQVQFYLVWPFLLIAIAAFAGRTRDRRRAAIGILFAIICASLAYSIRTTLKEPEPAYFNTAARLWEFALGGILALAMPRIQVAAHAAIGLGWLGLILVVSCGFALPTGVDFPGYAALWPAIGAMLVLGFGGVGRLGVGRILAARPLAALGDVSFTFYLWHWPVFIFALIWTKQTSLGLAEGCLVIAVALAAAIATHRFIELPALKRSFWTGTLTRRAVLAAYCTAPLTLVAALPDDTPAISSGQPSQSAQVPGAAVLPSAATAFDPRLPLVPSFQDVKQIHPNADREGCHQNNSAPEPIYCTYGPEQGATRTIAIVGGSHSLQWLQTFEILSDRHGWRIVNITKSGCPFEVSSLRPGPCQAWNDKVHDVLRALKPDVVFTTSTRSDLESSRNADREQARTGNRREVVPQGYVKQWERLAEAGISVVALRDNPRMSINVPDCLQINSGNPMACARPRADVMDPVDPTTELDPRPPNVSFIDLTDRFCDSTTCYPVIGNMIVYRDKHHLSVAFTRSIATILGERIKAVRPDLFPQEGTSG